VSGSSIRGRAAVALRGLFRAAGLHVERLERRPEETLMDVGALGVRTVIDVGANRGQFARRARALFPDARVLCFEPQPDAADELEAWARTQGGAVACFRTALGDAPGEAEMRRHAAHDASSSLLDTTAACEALFPQTADQDRIRVPVARLDDALEDADPPLRDAVFVKVDVQGFEDRVLRGAPRLLDRAAAVLVEVSTVGLYEGQASFAALVAILDAHGLRYRGNVEQQTDRRGRVLFLDAMFGRD
jgi:FkbM family methyltransferase